MDSYIGSFAERVLSVAIKRRGLDPIALRALRRATELRQRFGAVGKTGSIALIERLWRTLKDTLALRTLKPLMLADLK